MGKRAKGEGTGPFWSEARKKWVVQLPPGPDGRRPMGTADTQEEALAIKKRLFAERAAGRDLSRKAETVAELLEAWLEMMRPHIRATPLRHYRDGCRHISERIGKLRAQDVTIEHVQAVANALYAAGLGPATVRASLSRLWAAFDWLIPERFTINPVNWRKLKLRKVKRAKRYPLEAGQLRRLLEASRDLEARGAAVRWAPAVWLAATLGLRRGEILGLAWRDVDFQRAELHVRQQRAEGSPQPFDPPKTDDSARTLPIGPRLLALLQDHWTMLQAERRERRADWKEHGLVVCKEDGTPAGFHTLADQLAALEAVCRLPHVHPHLLRHSIASLLDELGQSQSVIGDLLGHSDNGALNAPKMTARYIRAREERLRRAVEAVEAAIFTATAEVAEEVS